jgi:POT family proton-dependent oligopeptide transporter
MALALAVFAAGKRYYATETIGPRPAVGPMERAEQRRVLVSLFGIFGLMVCFWVAYEHNDNLWVFFARDHMDLTAPSWVPEWFTREVVKNGVARSEIAPDQFQFINAALILILVPLSTWFWPRVDPTGRRFPHAAKMLMGFLFTAGAPAAMAAAAVIAGDGEKVAKFWIVLAYFLLTVGEVLVYGTGLDLSYAYAPARMKGFVTACFLLTIFLGNLINTQFTKFYEKLPGWWPLGGRPLTASEYFALDVGIVLAAAVAFYFVGRKFTRSHGAVALSAT